MTDKKDEPGYPVDGETGDLNAYFASLISTIEQPPAPITASLARLGAHLDRLASSALGALRLEGVLQRLSVRPGQAPALIPKLSQSTQVQPTAPARKG